MNNNNIEKKGGVFTITINCSLRAHTKRMIRHCEGAAWIFHPEAVGNKIIRALEIIRIKKLKSSAVS